MKAMTRNEKRICCRMLDDAAPLGEIAEILGRPEREIKIYAARRANMQKNRMKINACIQPKSQQLCWDCCLATGSISRRTREPCPWAAWKEPVPGWNAAEKNIRYRDGGKYREVQSYEIKFCPLFESDGKEDHNE